MARILWLKLSVTKTDGGVGIGVLGYQKLSWTWVRVRVRIRIRVRRVLGYRSLTNGQNVQKLNGSVYT